MAEAIIKLGLIDSGTVPSIVIESVALIVILPALPAAAVEASILPPSSRVRLEVSIVKLPAFPVPKVEALIALGVKTFGSTPTSSIELASMLTFPPSPELKAVAAIVPPSVALRVLVVMLLLPLSPEPKLAVTIELVTSELILLEPLTLTDSEALISMLPPEPPAEDPVLAITVPPLSIANRLVLMLIFPPLPLPKASLVMLLRTVPSSLVSLTVTDSEAVTLMLPAV